MTVDVSLIPQNRVENLITDLASKQSSSTAVTSVNNITPVNGNVSLTLPQVDQTYNSNSSNAQSGSAINGLDSTLVHKAGTETITGTKTFSNWPIIKRNYSSNDRDSRIKEQWDNVKLENNEALPSNSVFSGAHYYDGNNFEYGAHYSAIYIDGTINTSLWVHHPNGNATQIGIYQNASGNTWTTAPTPATSDNSTQIATTNWVRTLGFTPNYSTQLSISLPYTAPANGFVSGILTAAHSENYYILVNNIQVQRIYGETNQRVTAPFFIPVYKGDVITTTGGTNTVYFYYAR